MLATAVACLAFVVGWRASQPQAQRSPVKTPIRVYSAPITERLDEVVSGWSDTGLPLGGPVLIVYLGECASCAAKSHRPTEFAFSTVGRVLLVFVGDEAPGGFGPKELASNQSLVMLPRREMVSHLRPVAAPQWWLYEGGKLKSMASFVGEGFKP